MKTKKRLWKKKLIDLGAGADFVGKTKSAFYMDVHRGKVPHYRIGRLLRFDEDELSRWIDAPCKVTVEEALEASTR